MNTNGKKEKPTLNEAVSRSLNRVLEELAGGNKAELARILDISPGTLHPWLAGEAIPGGKALARLKELGYSADDILSGFSDAENRKSEHSSPHDLTTDDLDSYVKVNRYDIEASAGAGALVLDEHVVDQLTFKRSWLQGRKGWDPTELGLLQVRGDSMEPTLKGGDLILVNGERLGLHDGLYVVRLGDDVLVKRLRRIGPNEVEVISDNREIYPPFISKLNDGLHIIGEVVWFCRELK